MVTSATPPQPTWLTTAELAERWRMTTRTLERWRAERYGPAWHYIGGKVLYLLADVQAYEDRHRRKGS
jgi:hypothetical protein